MHLTAKKPKVASRRRQNRLTLNKKSTQITKKQQIRIPKRTIHATTTTLAPSSSTLQDPTAIRISPHIHPPMQSAADFEQELKDNADIAELQDTMLNAWATRPTQLKSIQFPEWCLDTFIPTKPFTSLLTEIAHSPTGEMALSKNCVRKVLIPLWDAYHENLKKNQNPVFGPQVENVFSPSAIKQDSGQPIHYPTILHHHLPNILTITRKHFDLKTGDMNSPDLTIFNTADSVSDDQFKELYDAAVLLRYVHHQEGLLKYIHAKFHEIADVALFNPSFIEEIKEHRRVFREEPNLRSELNEEEYTVEELRNMPSLMNVRIDITNSKWPLDVRYRYYLEKSPFHRNMIKLGVDPEPFDYLGVLSQCNLPSEPILHSLHNVAKQLSKASLLHDGGLTTFPLRQEITRYGHNVWSDLNVYINPTEKNKEQIYRERGEYDLDQFYSISLENRSTGGWSARADRIIPYPLTSVANPSKILSEPLPWKKVFEYSWRYIRHGFPLALHRYAAGDFPNDSADLLIPPYLRMLYTMKTVNQDTFGIGTDLEHNDRATKVPLINRTKPGQTFAQSTPLLKNPSKSMHMLGLPLFTEEYRVLYENSLEFQTAVSRVFDDETRHVINQLEAAYHSIQRQHERYDYHTELLRSTAVGKFVPEPFKPDPTSLQRYNDQAFYLQEIVHDLEVFAEAWTRLTSISDNSTVNYNDDEDYVDGNDSTGKDSSTLSDDVPVKKADKKVEKKNQQDSDDSEEQPIAEKASSSTTTTTTTGEKTQQITPATTSAQPTPREVISTATIESKTIPSTPTTEAEKRLHRTYYYPTATLNLPTGTLFYHERKTGSPELESKIEAMMFSTRQSTIFLEKWLYQCKKGEKFGGNDAAIDQAWRDYEDVNRIFRTYFTPTPDRRRAVASIYSEFFEQFLETTPNRNTSPSPHVIPDIDENQRALYHVKARFERLINPSETVEAQDGISAGIISLDTQLPGFTPPENPNPHPLEVRFDDYNDEPVKKPNYVCRPKGLPGQKRIISRLEFPSREDVYAFYKQLQPLAAKLQEGGLDADERLEMIGLREFYCLKQAE